MIEIPSYVQLACDRDRLSEPFMDASTGKWFAFPDGGAMAIEVESPYRYNGFNNQLGEAQLFEHLRISLEQRALNRQLAVSSSHSERMRSAISLHFPGRIGEGLLFYSRKNEIEGLVINGEYSIVHQQRRPFTG
jgi:hypothetical protein